MKPAAASWRRQRKEGLCICTAEYAVPIWLPKKLARKLGFSKIDYRLEDDCEDMEVYRYTCSD